MIVTDLRNSFHPCPKPLQKSQQRSAETGQKNKTEKTGQMRQKSKKLAKLERQRDKGLVKSGICEYCGKFSKRLDPHEIYRR